MRGARHPVPLGRLVDRLAYQLQMMGQTASLREGDSQ
jgi:hypothetical protein